MNNLITAGELARLASTTKRTIQFYDQKGVLKPTHVNESKYRLYQERQVLDYQMILLLSTLGVPLSEIKGYLNKKGGLSNLFNEKRQLIKNEIERLRFYLENIEQYQTNLKKNGTLVNPVIKMIKPFNVYYIEKVGSYAKIGKYCKELSEMFSDKGGKNFTTLVIFDDPGYRPKESHLKICTFVREKMKVKEKYKNIVRQTTFSPNKVISYVYRGGGDMLSLFWKELEKYCRLKGYKIKTDIPDYEVYWQVDANPVKQRFEIFLPID